MPKFKIKADVTERHSGLRTDVTGTISAPSERDARREVEKDMTRHGYTVDGAVKVERDNR